MPTTPPTTNSPSVTAGKTGVDVLVAWANAQDSWVRLLVSEVLQSRSELSVPVLDAIYARYRVEKGLAFGAVDAVPALAATQMPDEGVGELTLIKMGEVVGVNALAPGQELVFNKRLTIVFGENASGKTGYVRVLKRVASVRGAQPVLPSIWSKSPPKPSATITYTVDGAEHALKWTNEEGQPPFTRMAVFDSRSVALHVDDDLTYVFTPRDVALFRYVHQGIEQIQSRLERDRKLKEPGTNTFLPRFEKDATVYPLMEVLGASSNVVQLDSLGTVSTEEEARRETLKHLVEALRPEQIKARVQVASSDQSFYQGVVRLLEAFLAFDFVAYREAHLAIASAREAQAKQLSSVTPDPNATPAVQQAWLQFIIAAENYVQAANGEHYPDDADKCAYCRQDLTASATALLKSYRAFAGSDAQHQIEVSSKRLTALSALPKSWNWRTTLGEATRRTTTVPPAEHPSELTTAVSALEGLKPVVEALERGEVVDAGPTSSSAAAALTPVRDAAKAAAALVATLTKQQSEREAEHSKASAELAVLNNRVQLRSLFPSVKQHVESAQWASKAASLGGRFLGLLRSLTAQSKIASEQLLNQDFEDRFAVESKALRAPTVKLEFPGRKGQAARKKSLVPAYRLSEILSEGEQKVLALADFLAEASLRASVAPIVFDDPVNSLDYKRLSEVVNRIVALSSTRQVVVFSHNIWFVVELLTRFDKLPDEYSYYNVSAADPDHTGLISKASGPRSDSPKSLAGSINSTIQDAGPAKGEAQAALVERAYSLIRSWCEVVVEQELLAGVAQRYKPNIGMTMFAKIRVDRLDAARQPILEVFEKACRITEAHSQPLETLSVRPPLDELKADWKAIKDARDAYLAK